MAKKRPISDIEDFSEELLDKVNANIPKATKSFEHLNKMVESVNTRLIQQTDIIAKMGVYEKYKKFIPLVEKIADLTKDVANSSIDVMSNMTKVGTEAFKEIDLSEQLLEIQKLRNKLENNKANLSEDIYKFQTEILNGVEEELLAHEQINESLKLRHKTIEKITSKIESVFDKSMGFLESIPGGGLISKLLGGEETKKKFLDKFTSNFKDMTSKLLDDGDKNLTLFEKLKIGVKSFGNTLMSLKTGTLLLGIGLLVGALIGIVKLANKLNENIVETAKGLGLSKEEGAKLNKEFNNIALGSSHAYMNTENLLEASIQLNKEWGLSSKLSKETLESQLLLTKQLGLSEEQAIKIIERSSNINLTGRQYAASLKVITKQLNAQTKSQINYRDILSDVSELSSDIYDSFKGNLGNLVKSVYQARMLGTTLNDLKEVASNMMNIESSISDEMEARVLTGKNLNFQRARELAIQDRFAEMQLEILRQAGSLEKFQNQLTWQKEAEAKAAGMTVEQYTKMLQRAKVMKTYGIAIDEKTGKIAEKEWEKLKTMRAQGDELAQQVYKEMEMESNSEKLNALKEKLLHSMTLLVPVAERIMTTLTKILTGFSVWLEEENNINALTGILEASFWLITKPIEMIGKGLAWIYSSLQSIFGEGNKVAGVLTALMIPIGFKSLKGITKGFSGLFNMIGDSAKKLISKFPGGSIIDSIFPSEEKVKGRITRKTSIFKTIGDSLTALTKGISDSLVKLTKAVGTSFENIMSSIGKGISKFFAAFNKLDYTSILKGGLALGIIAGSVWVFAQAMGAFTDISWETVAKSIVALGALTLAIMGLGMIMSSGVGTVAILAGAAAMAIMAGGLWVLGKAMQEFGKASKEFIPFMESFSNIILQGISVIGSIIEKTIVSIGNATSLIFDSIIKLAQINPAILIGIGAGLMQISFGLMALTASNIFNRIGNLFGGNSVFKKLEDISTSLKDINFNNIAQSFGVLESVKYDYIANSIYKIASAYDTLTNSIENANSKLEKSNMSTGIIYNAKIDTPEIGITKNDNSQIEKEDNKALINVLSELISEFKLLRESVTQPAYIKIGERTVDELTKIQTLKRNMRLGFDSGRF